MAQVTIHPEKVGSAKCTVGSAYHMFDTYFGDAPCTNCGRDFCRTHAAKEPENAWTTGLCIGCGNAYLGEGSEGLRRMRVSVHRMHNS